MKFIIIVFCIAFVNAASFGQIPTKTGIDKDLATADKLWSNGKVLESMKMYKKNLKDSKQIVYSYGILECSLNLATFLTDNYNFKQADNYIKIAEKENLTFKSRYYSDIINKLAGDRFLNVGLLTEAINTYKKNLTSSSEIAAASCTNIGRCFEILKNIDSLLFYNKKGYQILLAENSVKFRRNLSVISINVGIVYLYPSRNLDSARHYMNIGTLIAKELNDPEALGAAYSGLGTLYMQTHKLDSAIYYFQKALVYTEPLKIPEETRKLYLKLGSAYELKKHYGKQLEYMKHYNRISDSLSRLDNLPFVVKAMVNENKILLNREKKHYTIIGIIIILIGLIIITFAYLKFRTYKKNQTIIIQEKDNQLESITKFKTQHEIDTLGVLHELAKAKDPIFFLKFNEFNSGFKDKLLKNHNSLNLNDIEFCSYLRMNFDTKEIAIYANMSVRAVEAKKYRIRKKLNLSSSDNINLYILDI